MSLQNKGKAAELDNMPFTQVDQGMNVADEYITSGYHKIKTFAEGLTESAYITVGYIDDPKSMSSFIEAESPNGKFLYREKINDSCRWAYINSIDDVSLIATIVKEGTLYYPEIRLLDEHGLIAKTYKCEYGTKEANAKLLSLIKYQNETYAVYPVDNNLVMIEIDKTNVVNSEKVKICDTNSYAYFFYDSINEKLWTCFKCYRSGRIMDYVYIINSLDDLNYSIASKNRFYREGTNTNTNFIKCSEDNIVIEYLKKNYLYTYSTNKASTITYAPDKVVYEDDDKKIFYEDNLNSNDQLGRKVFFVNKQGNYNIEIYNEEKTIYAGTGGFDIKGIVHSNIDETLNVIIRLNNTVLERSVKTNEDFDIHIGPDDISEGYYDEIYLEVGSSGNEQIFFGEIPAGSLINYNQTFYDKLDDNLMVERNPQKATYTIENEYNAIDKTQLLSKEEYNKYYQYISAISRFDFWLQDGKNYNGQYTSLNKLGYAYIIQRKNVKLNEKFTLNNVDGAYYNYLASDSKKKISNDIWVSYTPCKEPIVTIDSNKEFTNKDVTMTITFDGECADLKTKIHVSKENLDGVFENDFEMDFSNANANQYVFTESGLYQVSVIAESSCGNKSNVITKNFKIDKDVPIIYEVKYDDTWQNSNGTLWCKNKNTTAHVILRDLSGVNNSKQVDKYLYQIDNYSTSKLKTFIDIKDLAGNECSIEMDNLFLVDDIEPILQDPEIEYSNTKAEITLRAFDTESGLEGIYYKIGDEDEKKYIQAIVMPRDRYKQHTKVSICAKDIAGNKTEDVVLDIMLNDKPQIVLSEEYINATLDNLQSIHVESSDLDEDEVTLSIFYNDELLCSGTNNLEFNLKLYENLIRGFEYNKQHKFTIVASDGMDVTKAAFYVTKKNMKSIYKVTTRNLNFSNYSEVNISVHDLDDEEFGKTICIAKCNGLELGTFELNPGDNLIQLINKSLSGENEIEFELINKNYKEKIVRKINFIELNKYDEENIFIKINDTYSNDFFNYALSTRDNVFFYTENAERYISKDLAIELCNLVDAKPYVNSKKPVIIYGDKITNEDLIKLLEENNTLSTLCYETKSNVEIEHIIFSDYENDFYSDSRGKNRKLNVKFEKLNFENSSHDYEYTVYDLFNNLTDNKDSKKEIDFEQNNLDFEISNSGFYTLSISEWDEIRNNETDFSKESDEKIVSFYAHKKPICKLEYQELENVDDTIKISFTKIASDEDYISINNGILKDKVIIERYSFGGTLLDEQIIENEEKTFEIIINKDEITKVKYIVWDFGLAPDDNRFSFSSFDEVVINKININPFADFEYYVGNKNANGYIYKMTNWENVKFKNFSNYNDLLASTGERTESYLFDKDKFETMIANGDDLYNSLTITNKFGKKDTSISKKLDVCNIDVISISKLDDISKSTTSLIFDIINAKNKNEIYLMYDDEKIFCIDGKYYLYGLDSTSDELSITVKVYSKRDDSYLGEKEFNITFKDDFEIIDFVITNVYDPWTEVEVPVHISKMPVGVIRKGYAFDFTVSTKGFNNYGDYIYIIPSYYYLSNEGIKPCKIVNYSHGKITPYDMNIYNEGKSIGNLQYICLDNDDRYITSIGEIYLGKFYLPADARVKVGNNVYNSGDVLVNFTIIGASTSGSSYNFNELKWRDLNNSFYNQSGDTAIFDLKFNALEDYKNYLKY